MDSKQVALVQESFAKVAPIAPQAAALFYNNLFTLDPSLKPLFKGDMVAQGETLMQMIAAAVSKLTQLDVLVPVLQNLGKQHVAYGVVDSHYDTVGAALLQTLGQGLGEAFTVEVKEAWTSVYGVMATTMKAAAKEVA